MALDDLWNTETMNTTDVIRDISGTEMPAAGCWRIPPSHVTLTYHARTGVAHRVRGRASTVSGALDAAERPAASSLTLLIHAEGARGRSADPSLGELLGADGPADVVLSVESIEATSSGPWQALGELVVTGHRSHPATVVVHYHGVYRHGRDAKAWLTVRAVVPRDALGRRPRRAVELHADVLAVQPSFD